MAAKQPPKNVKVLAILRLRLNSNMAVSYTHLDVYKRQMLDIEANYQSDLTIAATTDHPSSDKSTSDKD